MHTLLPCRPPIPVLTSAAWTSLTFGRRLDLTKTHVKSPTRLALCSKTYGSTCDMCSSMLRLKWSRHALYALLSCSLPCASCFLPLKKLSALVLEEQCYIGCIRLTGCQPLVLQIYKLLHLALLAVVTFSGRSWNSARHILGLLASRHQHSRS
jgi:hypothetical protein